MRKTVIVMAVSLLLILAVGIFSGRYSLHASEEMQTRVRHIADEMQFGAWQQALDHVAELSQIWDEKSRVLQMWVVHEDADEVTVQLGRVKVAIEQQNETLGQVYCEELIQSLEHLYHRDAPHVKNIF